MILREDVNKTFDALDKKRDIYMRAMKRVDRIKTRKTHKLDRLTDKILGKLSDNTETRIKATDSFGKHIEKRKALKKLDPSYNVTTPAVSSRADKLKKILIR